MKNIYKKMKKVIIFTLLLTIALPTNIFAKTIQSNKVQAKIYGDYLGNSINLILDEYVGDTVTAEQLYEAAMYGMTFVLDDYSGYLSKSEFESFVKSMSGFVVGIGVSIKIGEDKVPYIYSVIKDSSAEKAGVLVNDKIVTINDFQTEGKLEGEIYEYISKDISPIVNLKVLRNGEYKTFKLEKEVLKNSSVFVENIENLIKGTSKNENLKYKYIYIKMIDSETAVDLKKEIQKLQKEGVTRIILDLRGNPGGFLDKTIEICNLIVPKGAILFTKNSKNEMKEYKSTLETPPFEKIVVVADKDTASAAEVITSALQDSGSKVVGETTFGKGVIQRLYDRALGGSLKLTMEEYFRRNGEKINKVGVTPDYLIELPDYVLSLSEETDIKNLKTVLTFIGFKVGETNKLNDPKTLEAIKEFQKQNSINVTGIMDSETILKINTILVSKFKEKDDALIKAYEVLLK